MCLWGLFLKDQFRFSASACGSYQTVRTDRWDGAAGGWGVWGGGRMSGGACTAEGKGTGCGGDKARGGGRWLNSSVVVKECLERREVCSGEGPYPPRIAAPPRWGAAPPQSCPLWWGDPRRWTGSPSGRKSPAPPCGTARRWWFRCWQRRRRAWITKMNRERLNNLTVM